MLPKNVLRARTVRKRLVHLEVLQLVQLDIIVQQEFRSPLPQTLVFMFEGKVLSFRPRAFRVPFLLFPLQLNVSPVLRVINAKTRVPLYHVQGMQLAVQLGPTQHHLVHNFVQRVSTEELSQISVANFVQKERMQNMVPWLILYFANRVHQVLSVRSWVFKIWKTRLHVLRDTCVEWVPILVINCQGDALQVIIAGLELLQKINTSTFVKKVLVVQRGHLFLKKLDFDVNLAFIVRKGPPQAIRKEQNVQLEQPPS